MSTSKYLGLSSLIDVYKPSLMPVRVCIVTPDILGPVKNSGIGTACSNLAFSLAAAGNNVEILLTRDNINETGEWNDEYRNKNIKMNYPRNNISSHGFFPDYAPLVMALRVYNWLSDNARFDLIIFMEWMGNGFYALHSKKCGLNFTSTALIVIIHSPSIWHITNNAASATNAFQSCLWHMERSCIEMADAVISPSLYMLDWCATHGYKLPQSYVQPNLLEMPEDCLNSSQAPINEIVFFGRLEYRKGLMQFCKALDILAKQGKLPPIITFLGKCAYIGNDHALIYISRHAKNWKNSQIQLLLHYNHAQSIKYLCCGERMAVMPSVADNSPYTVYECLAAGIPFLARDVGGISELVIKSDRRKVLFRDNPAQLAEMIEARIGHTPLRAQLSLDLSQNKEAWVYGLRILAARYGKTVNIPAQTPFISVCLVHYNRPGFLREAVASLEKQEYKNYEIILADDGSDMPEALACLNNLEPVFRSRNWKILRLENGFPGRARNIAASHARGEWLLFFDDDNLAKPDMLAKFAIAAQNAGGSLITSSFNVLESQINPGQSTLAERFLPLGNILSFSVLTNAIGDTTSLIKKEAFLKYGGFTEDYGLGNEDFELFLKLVINGENVAVIPDSLFWYRRFGNKFSINFHTNGPANRMRSFRPYMAMLPPQLAEMALMAHCVASENGFYGDGDNCGVVAQSHEDPQSDYTLECISALLSQEKQWALVDQIHESMNTAESIISPRFADLCGQCIRDARNGDMEKLLRSLAEVEKEREQLQPPLQIPALNNLNMRLLDILPKTGLGAEIRHAIVDKARRAAGNDIRLNLALAQENLESSQKDALACFMIALIAADKKYLEKRNDVATAIKNGVFRCGLHHYFLFGKRERAHWPEEHRFSIALRNMDLLIPQLCATHCVIYQYKNRSLAENMIKSLLSENCGAPGKGK